MRTQQALSGFRRSLRWLGRNLAHGLGRGSVQAGLALFILLVIYWKFALDEVFRVSGLFSFDPWYHMGATQAVLAQGGVIHFFEYYSGLVRVDYPTSLWIVAAAFHQVGGLDLLLQYRVLGLVARTATALVLYALAVAIVHHRGAALVAPALLLAAPYLYWRTLITFPENFALLFIVLAVYGMAQSLEAKKPTMLLALALAAHLYVHYRSAVISVALLTVFLGGGLLSRRFDPRQVLWFSTKLLLLAAPILAFAIQEQFTLLAWNVGPDALLAPEATDARYNPPGLQTYFNFLGTPLVVLSVLGAIAAVLSRKAMGLLVLFWAALGVVLTRGPEIYLYVPIDRMFAYLIVPLTLLGAMGVAQILRSASLRSTDLHPATAAILSSVIIVSMVTVLPGIQGFVAYPSARIDALVWLNEHAEEGSVIALAGSNILPHQVLDTRKVDFARISFWGSVVSENPEAVWSLLNETYPGTVVYFVTRTPLNLGPDTMVFSNPQISVYRLPTAGS